MDDYLRGLARARRERRRLWRRRTRLAVLFVASLLLVNALVGERSVLGLARADQERAILEQEIQLLRRENARLREQARLLREDPDAIGTVARHDLGLVGPGERVVLVESSPRGPR
jgi:cell division protein FtsB